MSKTRFSAAVTSPVFEQAKRRASERGLSMPEYVEDLMRLDLGLARARVPLSRRLQAINVWTETGALLARLRREGYSQNDAAMRRAIFVERKRRGDPLA